MFRVIRTMLDTIGGTLALLLIDVISFCLALRLFITQSLSEAPDRKMMVLAAVLSIVATCVTNRLLSSKRTMTLTNYAKDEGFDDEDSLGLSAESINFEAKDDSYYEEPDEFEYDIEDEGFDEEETEEIRYKISNLDIHNRILDRVESVDTSDCEGDVNHLVSNNVAKPHTNAFEEGYELELDFESGDSLKGFGTDKE